MATSETLTLDGLALNDYTSWRIQGLEMPPAKKRFEWTEGGDEDGGLLIRDPLTENREISCRLRVSPQATMDLALAKIGALVDKLEDAELTEGGIPLVWSPSQSTKTITFDVLAGEVDGLPITLDGEDVGWFFKMPVVTVKLYCKPYGRGAEVTGPTASGVTTPIATLELPSIPGDVPALGRLVVTDGSSQLRRYLEWGVEQRFYNASTSLIVESDSLVTTGYSGTGTTRSGAYDPGAAGNSVVRLSTISKPLGACGTGNLSHVGTFRVKARIYATSLGVMLRLAWQEGDGPFRGNPYVPPVVANAFSEVDLGLITIPVARAGTQRWTGRIEAYSTVTGDTLDVDYLLLVPAGEGYGKARGEAIVTRGLVTHRDDFDGGSGALAGRTSQAGGLWSGAGSATDFACAANAVERTTLVDTFPEGGRFAVLANAGPVDSLVEGTVSMVAAGAASTIDGLVARYIDTNNWFRATALSEITGRRLRVQKKVAGVLTTLLDVIGDLPLGGVMALETRSDGSWKFTHGSYGTVTGVDVVLRTGGALASGKVGIYDACSGGNAVSRYFDFFVVTDLGLPPVVLNSGRTAEIRDDAATRYDSTGVYNGLMPGYRGSFLKFPPAGDNNLTTRLAVKAQRSDIEAGVDEPLADSISIATFYTPRYSVVPR